MYYKKNLSIYDSTFPCVWVSVLTWWLDRLLVELGHRSSDSAVCAHNDLQYVRLHQSVGATLAAFQMIKAVARRRREYVREAQLVQSTVHRCTSAWIVVTQSLLVTAWAVIFSVLLDVSPWLCLPWVLQNRAVVAAVSFVCILLTLPLEAMVWDCCLQRGLLNEV